MICPAHISTPGAMPDRNSVYPFSINMGGKRFFQRDASGRGFVAEPRQLLRAMPGKCAGMVDKPCEGCKLIGILLRLHSFCSLFHGNPSNFILVL